MVWFDVFPLLDPLREDPRFAALVKRISEPHRVRWEGEGVGARGEQ